MMLAPDVRFERLRPLVGRETELATIRDRLADARLVTLTGPGGVGKTRLALEVAAEHEATFVDLSTINERSLVAPEVAAALGAEPDPSRLPEERIASAIGLSDRLLILDNLEQIEGASGAVGAILIAAPAARILATSRTLIGLPGEVQVPVAPLGLPRSDQPEDVAASPACRLFLWLALAIGQDLSFDAESAASVAALCRRLDGLPLALELAAARTRILSPAAILARLGTGSTSLLSRPAPGRHSSLDAVLLWSFDLLRDEHRRELLAFSVCPGGVDVAVAEALAPEGDVLSALDELVASGLMKVTGGGDEEGGPRFAMLETIRSAARARLAPEDSRLAWRRLADYIAALTATFGTKMLQPGTSDVARLDQERDNIRAVLDWALENDPDLGLEIASRCRDHWVSRGITIEGIERLVHLSSAAKSSSASRAHGLVTLADMQFEAAGRAAAEPTAVGALEAALSAGDVVAEARARGWLSRFLSQRGEHAAAARHLERVQAIAAAFPDSPLALRVNQDLAYAAESRGEIPAAIDLWEAVARQARIAGYLEAEALAMGNLSELQLDSGEPGPALNSAISGLNLLRRAGPWPIGVAWLLAQTAEAHSRLGNHEAARNALREAVGVAREHPTQLALLGVLMASCGVFTELGDVVLACNALGAARLISDARQESSAPGEARSIDLDLARARRWADPVKVELAIRAGYEAGPEAVVKDIETALVRDDRARSRPPRVGLQHGDLTRREIDVLTLLGAGRSDAEIAEALFISPKTASVHVSNIKGKLGVATRLEAALKARELGLAPEAES